jgi:hypothetical protein
VEELLEILEYVFIHRPCTLKFKHWSVAFTVFSVVTLFTEGAKISETVGASTTSWDTMIDVECFDDFGGSRTAGASVVVSFKYGFSDLLPVCDGRILLNL